MQKLGWIWPFVIVGALIVFAAAHRADSHPKGESWDQENLKRNDSGCPTAVFVAPHGNLVQCP